MATKNKQDVVLYEVAEGEPREVTFGGRGEQEQDVIKVDLSYYKGRGYYLSGRVFRQEGASVMIFAMFTGISVTKKILEAKRFSAKKLATLQTLVESDGTLDRVVENLRLELQRRRKTGEGY